MPAYAFEITWDGGEKRSWTYLPTDEIARGFARLLLQDFKRGDQYRGAAHITVKDQEGAVVASIPF